MGGGDTSVKETPQEQALAKVAMSQWQDYLKTYVPFENTYMDEVDRLNTGAQYDTAATLSALPIEAAYSEAVTDTAGAMVQRGINPNSAKFKEQMTDIDTAKRAAKADNINQAQVGQQSRYLDGVSNVVAMGQGQATTAINGMSDIATQSSREAYSKANRALQRNSDRRAVVGAAVGAGTRYGLNIEDGGDQ